MFSFEKLYGRSRPCYAVWDKLEVLDLVEKGDELSDFEIILAHTSLSPKIEYPFLFRIWIALGKPGRGARWG